MNAIKRLERLQGMLAHDKASLIMVHGGFKPAAQVVMQGEPFLASGNVTPIEPRLTDELFSILSKLKLKYVTTSEIMEARTNDESNMLQDVMRIYVARSQEAATALKTAFDDIQKNHSSAGIMLGYPETAVEAFLTPEMLEWEDHPISTEEVSELNMKLLGHRLSKTNWRDEVRYLEAAGNYVKEVSLNIYNEATEQ